MADVMPKIKTYIFLSIISLIISIGVIAYNMIQTDEFNKDDIGIGEQNDKFGNEIATGGLAIAGAFIPYITLLSIAIAGIPLEISIFLGIVVTIISSVQLVILVMILLSIISNLFWHPDV